MKNQSTLSYALVTGASSGIGKEITKILADRGYSIIAVSNQEEQLKALKAEIEKEYSVSVITFFIDLSAPDAAEKVFDHCRSGGYTVEVLVNNAGIYFSGEVSDVETEKAKKLLQLHMNTPAILCHLFGKQMKIRKKGYILNVSSISAVMPYPVISFYAPSKTFLRAFTRALRTEMKPYHVHVTCLMPGATLTSLFSLEPTVNIKMLSRTGILMTPDKVARKGVNGLFKNKDEVIPGYTNKLFFTLSKWTPHCVISMINHKRVKKETR